MENNKKSFWTVFTNFFKKENVPLENNPIRKKKALDEFDVYFMKLLKDGNCEDAIKLVDEGYVPHHSFLDSIEDHFLYLALRKGGLTKSEFIHQDMTIFSEKSNLDGLNSDNNFIKLCLKIDFSKNFIDKYLNGIGEYIKADSFTETGRKIKSGNWKFEYATVDLNYDTFTAGQKKSASLLTGALTGLFFENIKTNNQLFNKNPNQGIYLNTIANDLSLLTMVLSPLFYGIVTKQKENPSISFEEAYKSTIKTILDFDVTKISEEGFMGTDLKRTMINVLKKEKEQAFSELTTGILLKPYFEIEKLFESGSETPESLFIKTLSAVEKYPDLSNLLVMIICFHAKEVEHLITMDNIKKMNNVDMMMVNIILEQREKIIQNNETNNMLEKFKNNKNTEIFSSPLDMKNKEALEKVVREGKLNLLVEPVINIESILLDLSNKKLDAETRNFLDNVRMSIYEMIKTFQDIAQIDSSVSQKETLLKPIKEIETKIVGIQKDVLTQQLAALNGTSVSAKVRVR